MSEDAEKVFRDYTEMGLTDGLPIVPPTRDRVNRMLDYTDRRPDDVLGKVPPSEDETTVEAAAICAVMAGCKPEYFPVVVTEINTLLDRPNLRGAIATTGPCWPFAVVNGPIAKEIGLYSSWGLLGTGPNHMANLTIGRTMTLVIQNIGKSVPGVSEKKPLWNLGRYGICIKEDEDNSPWEPLHVEKGFQKETSTVTVFDEVSLGRGGQVGGGTGYFELDMTHSAQNLTRQYGVQRAIVPPGEASLCICSAAVAKNFIEKGWKKQDVKDFYYENVRSNPQDWHADYPPELREDLMRLAFSMSPPWMKMSKSVPLFRSPDDIWIVVAGALGGTWSIHEHHGGHPGLIKQITLADGTPAKSVKDFKRTK
ncbi:MAG: hypothetical protein V1915_03640 [Candidatus Bathyarchaeota archaeon]